MLEDLIERAYAHGIVRTVVPVAGCDEYVLERRDGRGHPGEVVLVRVRDDGRFSRAEGADGTLTLGQVAARCGLRSEVTVAHPSGPRRSAGEV